jgi:hypothetical protein
LKNIVFGLSSLEDPKTLQNHKRLKQKLVTFLKKEGFYIDEEAYDEPNVWGSINRFTHYAHKDTNFGVRIEETRKGKSSK